MATRGWSRVAAVSAVLGAMALVAACSTVVDGAPHAAPGGPAPGEVDVNLLDTGNYPTEPRPPLGSAGSPEKGGLVAATQIGEHVVGPWEVDPALAAGVIPTLPLKNADAVSLVLSEPVAAAAGEHNFISGFSSTRRTEPDQRSLVNAVLWFADAQSAAAAATEFSELDRQPGLKEYLPAGQPVSVPGHPDTRASTYETPNPWGSGPETNITAYTAHGPFVLIQTADSTDGLESAMSLVTKTLDLQIPRIDKFEPSDPSKLAELPVDETGLLAKTIPQTGDRYFVGKNLVYGPHAALHFQMSPASSQDLFAETGMDLWSSGKTSLYQARDAGAALEIVDQFVKESQDSGAKPAPAVPNMADSHCLEHDKPQGTNIVCFAAADRYVIEASSAQLTDVHQAIAAQYVILTDT